MMTRYRPSTRRLMTRAACVAALGATTLLTGCIVVVHDSKSYSSYDPYPGTDLRLVVTPAETDRPDAAHPDEPVIGTWRGEGKFVSPPSTKFVAYGLEVREDRNGGVSRRYSTASKDGLEGLPSETVGDRQPLLFSLRRDAGTLVFDGERDGSTATGTVRFRRSDSFAAAANSLTGRDLSTMELFALASRGVTQTDIDDFRTAGVTLSPHEIVRLRDQGITGAYYRDINANITTGQRYSIDDAIRLRNHGVTAAYLKELRDAGAKADVDDVVKLRNAGVSADDLATLHQPGAELPSTTDIVRLRNSGVRASTIADLRSAGYNFSIDDTIRLHNHGVSATYAKDVQSAGYIASAEDLIRLRNNGISSQYLRDLQEPGQPPLPIETVIDARNKGLSADFVKKLRHTNP